MARLNEPPAAASTLAAASLGAGSNTTASQQSLESENHEFRKYFLDHPFPQSINECPTTSFAHTMRTKSRPPKPQPQHQPPQQHHHLPTDIEEVKRRYMRQNRDLARQTNIQAQRIRILEGDVSRLQAENLELRHQTQQAERAKWRMQAQTAGRVGEELSSKIGELYRIVCGLQDTQREAESRLSDLSAVDAEGRRPMEGHWRERQTLSEIMQETLMPTIVEDKHYPRRTLDAGEINAIRLSDPSTGNSNESPDLGPPPVAHFDYEDPVKHASPLRNKSPPESTSVEEGEADELPESLTMNLETRRRRKDGPSKPVDSRRHSLLPQSPAKADEGEQSPTSLRTGTKRKLADRDTEKSFKPPNEGDFTFTRKATAPRESTRQESKTVAGQVRSSRDSTTDSSTTVTKPSRKILGDKSANMSPRKASATLMSADEQKAEKEKPSKPTAPVNAASTRRRRVSFVPEPQTQKNTSDENETAPHTIDESSLPSLPEQKPSHLLPTITSESLEAPQTSQPTTPAPPTEDFLSPIPSEPSSQQPRSLDPSGGRSGTPPPSNLLSALSSAVASEHGGSAAAMAAGVSSASTTSASSARPSRRSARGSAVNYAEPSLVAKMRRPDKKMVDALTGLQDPRRVMNASLLLSGEKEREGRERGSRDGSVEVEVKVEEGEEGGEVEERRDEEAWKALPPASNVEPGSPLGGKGESAAAAAAEAAEADFRPSSVALQEGSKSDDHLPASTTSASSTSPRSLLPARSHHRRRHSAAQLSQPTALTDNKASDVTRRSSPAHDEKDIAAAEAAAKRLEELEIYDFKDSSPAPSRSSDPLEANSISSTLPVSARGPKKGDGPAITSDKREKKVTKRETKTEIGKAGANSNLAATSGTATATHQQRRHSTLPSKSSSLEQGIAAGSRGKSGNVDSDVEAAVVTGKVKNLGSAGSRRRSMML